MNLFDNIANGKTYTITALSVASSDEIENTNCPIHSLSEHEHEKPSMVMTLTAVISSVSGSSRGGSCFTPTPCNKHNNNNKTNQQSLFSHDVSPHLQMIDTFSIPP